MIDTMKKNPVTVLQTDGESIVSRLRKWFALDSPESFSFEEERQGTALLLDTFDSEIREAGCLLIQAGNTLLLVDLAGGEFVEQHVGEAWRFVTDLADGPVGQKLCFVSRLRAFMVVGEVQLSSGWGAVSMMSGKGVCVCASLY